MRRLSVTIFGLFPTTYSTCAPCCPTDMLYGCDIELNQIEEYPVKVIENHNFLVETVYEFMRLGNKVLITIVGADSIRGLLLSLRYRLGSGPAIIVKDKVFKGKGLRNIREAVKYAESLISKGYEGVSSKQVSD